MPISGQGQISKYRNYKAAPLHQRFHIDNLHNIATTCPSESELIEGKKLWGRFVGIECAFQHLDLEHERSIFLF